MAEAESANSSGNTAGYGQQQPWDSASDFAVQDFHITQRLARLRTSIPVKILSVKAGGIAKYSTVSVLPMVKQIDGNNNLVSHGTVYNIPVMRLAGGDSMMVMDPSVGDLGFMGLCDRDISAFKASGNESPPGSLRRHSFSDGVYFGKIGGAAPNQYVLFDANGIKIVDRNGNQIVMKPGEIDTTTAIFKVIGEIRATGEITAGYGGGDSVTLQQHTHHPTDPTSPPIPGT